MSESPKTSESKRSELPKTSESPEMSESLKPNDLLDSILGDIKEIINTNNLLETIVTDVRQVVDMSHVIDPIPKHIYICHKNLDDLQAPMREWLALNPSFEGHLFNNELSVQFLTEYFSPEHAACFNYIVHGPIKADFWRLCILYVFGGVYADADIQPVEPLDFFIMPEADLVTVKGMLFNTFNPHFIAAKPRSQLLLETINLYMDFYRKKRKYTYWEWSIMALFRSVLRRHIDTAIIKENKLITIGNEAVQFLKEVSTENGIYDIHSVYKKKRVFTNRRPDYDPFQHAFKKGVAITPK